MSKRDTAYQDAEERVRLSIQFVRGDDVKVSKADIALSESSYRRGFQQGLQAAIDAIEEGADITALHRYQGLLSKWRQRTGKWSSTTYKACPPPHWTGKGVF